MHERIIHGENLGVLDSLADESFALVYIDPPFNTGREQRHRGTEARRRHGGTEAQRHIGEGTEARRSDGATQRRSDEGEEERSASYVGFGGVEYERVPVGAERSYRDSFDDFLAFLRPRLEQARRVLTPTGSLFFHIDPRESHYCKVLLDEVFGRGSFMNEIVWAYDFGGRSKRRWPAKHDVLFWYAKDPDRYTFNYDAMDRIPYMAPGLVGPEKAQRGKTPTDVWWQTIVSPTGKEKTGYPTQKPLAILRRILSVHTNPGEEVLDFFAGSGTTGAAARELGRGFTLVDENEQAIEVMTSRLDLPVSVLERTSG